MKLDELHKATPLDAALISNVAVKSMLQPMGGRAYYWKNFDTDPIRGQPEPIPSGGGGGGLHGGNYGAAVEGNPRHKKYFGGLPYGSQPI